MTEQELNLACALWSYEADASHVNLPGLDVGAESEQYYAPITHEEFLKLLASDHNGDCIKCASPCRRCHAECTAHKAKWLIRRLADS